MLIQKKIIMTENERIKLSSFVEKEMGIKMPPSKKVMLESRLTKRLNALGCNSFSEYYEYIMSNVGYSNEILMFVNVVSTNKTDFFREPKHWDYLKNYILPEFAKQKNSFRKIEAWSAACSSGEEPYSLAMMFEEFLSQSKTRIFDYSIFATDISTDMLQIAFRAVYKSETVQPVPNLFKYKYLMRNIHNQGLYRIIPEIRAKILFRRLNLISDDYNIQKKMDLIFCRNVLIYFDRVKQEKIIKNISRYLKKGGYLIIGHSESMVGFKVNLINVVPTIYRKI
jgi:chemotaxis protein methyltransferase CheR